MRRAAVRASDAERDRTLRMLRSHYAAGRLEHDELEDRIEHAARARFLRDLDVLVVDLPRAPALAARGAQVAARVERAALRAHVAAYGCCNGALVAAWAAGGAHEFWPAVTIMPWGVVLAGHAWCSRAARRVLGRALDAGEAPRRLAR
jgi:hypothetical protein